MQILWKGSPNKTKGRAGYKPQAVLARAIVAGEQVRRDGRERASARAERHEIAVDRRLRIEPARPVEPEWETLGHVEPETGRRPSGQQDGENGRGRDVPGNSSPPMVPEKDPTSLWVFARAGGLL